MFGLLATSEAVPNSQLSLYQTRLQQARREAKQAEENVRALETRTEQAEREAERAQNSVRTLEEQAPRPAPTVNTLGEVTGRLLDEKA